MSDSKWSHIVAIFAVVGSIVGTVMTTHYQVVSAEIQAKKEISALQAANARVFLDQFTEKTEPVTVAFNNLTLVSPDGSFSLEELKAKANDLSAKGAALMPYIDSDLYMDLQDVAMTAAFYADEPDAEKRKPLIAALNRGMAKFMVDYFRFRDNLQLKVPVPH